MERPTAELATLAPTALAVALPELARLADVARASIEAALAPNTLRTYRRQWARFAAFAARFGTPATPAAPELVLGYLASLADRGLTPGSLVVALAAIRWGHEVAHAEAPLGDAVVRRFMQGRRALDAVARPGVRGQAPLLLDELRTLVAVAPRGLRGARDRAILLLGWFGALRRSELVALDVASVVEVEQGLELWIGGSKANRTGPAELVAVPYASDPKLCPVRAVRRWRELAGMTEGPLFRRVTSGVVRDAALAATGVAVVAALRRAQVAAGVVAPRAGAHRLRAGFATQAARAHKDTRAIQAHLRHATPEMTLRYVKHVERWDQNPATGLA